MYEEIKGRPLYVIDEQINFEPEKVLNPSSLLNNAVPRIAAQDSHPINMKRGLSGV